MSDVRIEEKTGFVGKGMLDAPFVLSVKEGEFETFLEEIIVLHKRQMKIIKTKDVGDGMSILQIKNVKQKNNNLMMLAYVVSGMSVYQWFDENTGATDAYAYGFDSSKADRVEQVSESLGLGVSLELGKFVKIVSQEQSPTILSQEDFSGPDILQKSLSFLFGLMLIYGGFDSEGEVIDHAVIQLPLVGSIATYEDVILHIQEMLAQQQLYITIDYVPMKSGQMMQINSNDREILDIRAQWLGGEEQGDDDLRELLGDLGDIDIDLTNYTLKLLRK